MSTNLISRGVKAYFMKFYTKIGEMFSSLALVGQKGKLHQPFSALRGLNLHFC